MVQLIRAHWRPVVLAIAVGILCSAPAVYFRYSDSGYKGVDFFGSDAENYYLGQIQEIYDGHFFSGNIFAIEGKNDPYVQQPMPAMIVAFLGKFLGISARDVNILTKFLFPAFLTLIVYALFLNLTGRKDLAIPMTAFVMMVQATWIFLNPPSWLPLLLRGEFVGTDYNFISYARPINPQISSIFFFGYLLCIWNFLSGGFSGKTEKICGIAGAVILGLSFYIYFFTFSFLLVFNPVLFFCFLLYGDRVRLKKIFFVSIGALVIAIPYFANVFELMKSPDYAQLAHRSNIAENHRFIFSRVWWGVTALFLLFYRGSSETKIFISAFLATAFLVTNQQLITGKTLPLPAHYHWYYIAPVGGAILFYLLLVNIEKFFNLYISRLMPAIFTLMFLYAGFSYQKISYEKQLPYFISNQRYASVLSWLDGNIPDERSIFADYTLSNFIPAYTRHNVYYVGLLSDSLTSEERIRKSLYVYFFLGGVSGDSARDFFYENRDFIGAQIFSDYYRQKNGCHGCFPDSILDGFILEYQEFLKKDFLEQLKKYRIDYAVWDKEKNPEWQLDRFFTDKIYDQNNLVIYKI